ncbi:hypothetical protein [Amycolatopsis jiangsuensis]|uniref:Glycosyltransferase RgtA/B/C/D-like domain-containing protein n=1 Tax=Amycolatopsis jiangsuensis TaxID=1181879 RepID=A0A840IZ97_9PSEU|nr:hypothetical protein [Amycolatopsis jiangsuensis]MBB4687013.1 hypothetical protein [Amycolatopsis jiangsuensis]
MVYAVVGGWLVLAALVVACWRRIASDRRWRTAALLCALAFSLLHQLLFAAETEDAFVSFRYAQNIADGTGPVFNAGDRTEGYSNFLWLVVIALPRAAFGVAVPASAMVLSALATLGCVLLAYFLADRVTELALPPGAEPRRAVGVTAAVLTAGASGPAVYGASGTELPMFVLLVLAVAYALVARRPVVAGVLVAGAVMTRPEGLVLAVVAGLWLVAAAARERHTWWAPVGYALGALVFLVPWTAWRATYYHQFRAGQLHLPSPDWPYLAGFALAHLAFLVPGVVAAGALLRARDRANEARSVLWFLLALAAGLTVFAVVLAHDPDPAWRLLAPVPPLLAVASAGAYGVLTAARPSPKPRTYSRLVPATAAALAGVAVAASLVSPQVLSRVHTWRTHGAQLAEIGDWLSHYLPPGSVVSAGAPGVLASRAGGRVLVIGQGAGRSTLTVPGRDGYAQSQDCTGGRFDGYRVATFHRTGTPFWIAVYPRADEVTRLVGDLDEAPGFQYVACP